MVSNEQRRKQLAREKYLRQQQRREAARRKSQRRVAVVSSVLAVALLAGAAAAAAGAFKSDGGDGSGGQADGDTSSPPSPEQSSEPKLTVDKKATYTMTLETDRGRVRIATDAAKTPHTVNSFKHLADKGFFDKTKCHRLTTEGIKVLQCGDPEGTGEGGPGYNIPDENLDALGKPGKQGTVTYPAGTVAMANTGEPDSGGSQFFLVYEDSELPPSYTPFGTMDKAGLQTVAGVAKAGVSGGGKDGAPKKAVTVKKATVKKD